MRTPHGQFPEYHTSADDLDFVRPERAGRLVLRQAAATWSTCSRATGVYRNLNPKGEPQLGRRGLYDAIGGGTDGATLQLALLWVLNLSDGEHEPARHRRARRASLRHGRRCC